MRLIKNLIERKAKIEALENEEKELKAELEHLYFTQIRNLKIWKRPYTLLSNKIRKILYIPEVKLRGRKRVLQLEDKKQQLIDLINEIKEQMNECKIENTSKIG